jgi:alkanesulfonate monooxygenase SsuD/methylene tetrahydromethanopterin reductase-like flavin-dependent oxidoreductase (luciferase family)
MKVGLVLVIAEHPELRRPYSYQKTREIALQAEEAGFDSLWLYDHLLYRPEGKPTIGIWECWTFLSALAEATNKVNLGTLVACNSFRNPALLAKMAITLDEVSNGRLILGIGAGWNQPEYEAFGYPFDHCVSRFEEALCW